MPYLKGYATSFDDIISKLCTWVENMDIHGADAWEVMRQEPWPRGTILKAPGWEAGEHQYIGLMPTIIQKGITYPKWFLSEQVLTSEFVWSQKGLNFKPENTTFSIVDGTVIVMIKNSRGEIVDSISYSFSPLPEIFDKSAQAMFLGVFKQYSDGLAWHEQAGADRPAVKTKEINYYNSRSQYPTKFLPPPLPGVGFPAIGMALTGSENGYLKFWITKDRHRLILVINNGGYWDVAYLGFMEAYHKPTEYAFPATVIGGTSGVVPVGETFWYQAPIPEVGFRFDYSPTNWSLAHGLPCFAATPWDGTSSWLDSTALSQVQVMLPDGTWQSFANWAVQQEIIAEYSGGSYPAYYYAHKEPEKPPGLRHYIRPTFSNTGRTEHIYKSTITDTLTYQLEPLELVQGRNDARNIFGRLWRMYWPSCPVYHYGEQIINGKLHLILPNAWEGRRWHIAHGRTHITDVDQLLEQDRHIDELTRSMNCIIRLED